MYIPACLSVSVCWKTAAFLVVTRDRLIIRPSRACPVNVGLLAVPFSALYRSTLSPSLTTTWIFSPIPALLLTPKRSATSPPHPRLPKMSSVVKLVPSRTAFFVCDIQVRLCSPARATRADPRDRPRQERFRTAIHAYPSVIATAEKMVKGAKLLSVPVVVTEQNPKALGATVPLPLADLPAGLHPEYSPLAKTKFSMVLPEVEKSLREWKTESVVLFGIEASPSCSRRRTELELTLTSTQSHVCVLQTALDLLERNIAVHILADGVSSCNHDEVEVALAVRLAVHTVTSRDADPELSASPSFRSANYDQRIGAVPAHGYAGRECRSPKDFGVQLD